MAAKGVSGTELYQPHTSFDLLRVPGLGRLLRWRWGRLVMQLPLLALAALVVYDGLTGPQLAPQNIATVSVWVHFRGFAILALLLAGNLFCMACPFTLPRTLARRISSRGRRWPKALRNKWLAIAVFVGYLWLYEALDLWASPALTAWLVIGYFVAAFVLEALSAESPFCKYVCPLGTFNFVASSASPLQITARRVDVCRTCVGKECVNGSAQTLGCGTELFVPQVKSNLDCTFCLDCARACPHDNVALAARKPLSEFIPLAVKPATPGAAARPAGSAWPRRWDVAFLALVFAFAGLANAFGMTPPVYTVAAALSRALGTKNEALILALIFGVLMVLLPAALGLGAAILSRRMGAGQGRRWNRGSLRAVFARYAPTVVPLAFAIWFAHYWFHFASGALAIAPVAQNFLIDHGITLLGSRPNWALGSIMSDDAVFVLVLAAVAIGYLGSLYSLSRTATAEGDPQASRRAMLPWLALWTVLALAALLIFTLPMEMRGMVG